MFQLLTIMSFFILLPIAIFVEGTPVLPASLAAAVSQGLQLDYGGESGIRVACWAQD